MKQITLIAFLLLTLNKVQAQEEQDPVKWDISYVRTGETEGEVHFTATLKHPWHIYAQLQPKNALSKPTHFKFGSNPLFSTVGTPKEVGKKEVYSNKEIGVTQYQYGNKVDFVQRIKLKAKVKTNASGTITYQACNEERCLPIMNIPFSVNIQ